MENQLSHLPYLVKLLKMEKENLSQIRTRKYTKNCRRIKKHGRVMKQCILCCYLVSDCRKCGIIECESENCRKKISAECNFEMKARCPYCLDWFGGENTSSIGTKFWKKETIFRFFLTKQLSPFKGYQSRILLNILIK